MQGFHSLPLVLFIAFLRVNLRLIAMKSTFSLYKKRTFFTRIYKYSCLLEACKGDPYENQNVNYDSDGRIYCGLQHSGVECSTGAFCGDGGGSCNSASSFASTD